MNKQSHPKPGFAGALTKLLTVSLGGGKAAPARPPVNNFA